LYWPIGFVGEVHEYQSPVSFTTDLYALKRMRTYANALNVLFDVSDSGRLGEAQLAYHLPFSLSSIFGKQIFVSWKKDRSSQIRLIGS
jgi:hypothetical protein